MALDLARLRNRPATCGLLAVAMLALLWPVAAEVRRPLLFDDAFMFWRYALHLREGLGLAWNPDGVATYGLTSQLWILVVLPLTATMLAADTALKLASFGTGLVALCATIWTARRHGGRAATVVAGALAVLALAIGPLTYHFTTGMDTMLSLLCNTLLIAAVLEWRKGGARPAALVGLAAFATVLARPENIIVAFGVPALAWLLLARRPHRLDEALLAFAMPAALLALDLLLCRIAYGTALPLSFYAKSSVGYAGFLNRETPVRYMAEALPAALPALSLLIVFGRRQAPLILAVAIPVAVTFVYLATVRQIMGFGGRYYIPFLPFILIPAAIAAADGRSSPMVRPAVLLLAMWAAVQLSLPLIVRADAAWLRMTLPAPIRSIEPRLTAAVPLPPLDEGRAWAIVAQRVVARLPAGSTIAASEVGQIGAVAPDIAIIDLAGLNDREIGLQGFSARRLVDRAPDLIWLPHSDYTGARAALLADPAFRTRYRLVVGAFDFGMAVRLDGPRRAAIERVVAQAWRETYPRYAMDDYVARWPGALARR